jgi:hypothetical protein
MVSLMSLWLPILLAAVVVFAASFVIHMVLPYHRSDYRKVPSEDEAMAALRKIGVQPGDYFMPHGGGPAAMKDPAFIEKMKQGPIAVMTVMPSGAPTMGPQLVQWFIYCVVVGVFAGYVAGRALPSGAEYLAVFRLAGTTAFVGYCLALWHDSIWYKRAWSTTLKQTLDGLVYALLTAGTFGWLWPR